MCPGGASYVSGEAPRFHVQECEATVDAFVYRSRVAVLMASPPERRERERERRDADQHDGRERGRPNQPLASSGRDANYSGSDVARDRRAREHDQRGDNRPAVLAPEPVRRSFPSRRRIAARIARPSIPVRAL